VTAQLGLPATAVIDQEADQVSCAFGVDRVQDALLLAPGSQEAGSLELCEVCRQGRRGDVESFRDLPGRQSARRQADQQPKYRKAQLVGKRGESGGVHISDLPEIPNPSQT
jgi:hypothetical protein